jgi:deazaflavin-dependent oxidoreductase (nitroreductase family)
MLSDAEWLERNARVIEEFRANDGRLERQDLVLLTTTGAKTGRQVTSPLLYLREGETVYVIASKQGSPSHPAWYHNLVAHPEVVLEIGGERWNARARVLDAAERDRVYAAQVARYPFFADYQQQATRTIPVVAIERA